MDIQERIVQKKVELAWSYILDFENEMNPIEQRRIAIRQWRKHATIDTDATEEIIEKAEELFHTGLKSKDALHGACAILLKCDFFLTTDEQLIKKAVGIREISVTDPITFIREEPE